MPRIFSWLWRVRRIAHDGYWWVRHRVDPRHKYHLVNTGLRPDYYDQDTRMLNACFALLADYIDEMGGIEAIEKFNVELRGPPDGCHHSTKEANSAQADRQAEAVALYRWWTIERLADQHREDELVSLLYGLYGVNGLPAAADAALLKAEHNALVEKIAGDEQAMLHRLIDIRTSLWT